jgi:hypothetical protein
MREASRHLQGLPIGDKEGRTRVLGAIIGL